MVNQDFCAVRVTKTVLLSYGYILIIRKRIGCKDLSDKKTNLLISVDRMWHSISGLIFHNHYINISLSQY